MQFDTNKAKLHQHQKWDSRPNRTLQLNFPSDQAPFMCPWYVEVSTAHPGYPGQANFSFSFRLG